MFRTITAALNRETFNNFEPVVLLPAWKSVIVDMLSFYTFGLCRWRWGGITLDEWYKGFSGPAQITCDAAVKADSEAMKLIEEFAELTGSTIVGNPCPRLDLWGGKCCHVPEHVAKCPECGGQLEVDCMSWVETTGQPIAADLNLICKEEPYDDGDFGIPHSWHQSKWYPAREAVIKWAEAIHRFEADGRITGIGDSVDQ